MAARVRQRTRAAASFLKRGAASLAQGAVTPPFVQRQVEAATRGGQWLAFFLLFVMVPLSLFMVKVVNTMLIQFVLRGTSGPEHTPFVVTLVTFAFLVMVSWFWFQWVRTAGFGMTNVAPKAGG